MLGKKEQSSGFLNTDRQSQDTRLGIAQLQRSRAFAHTCPRMPGCKFVLLSVMQPCMMQQIGRAAPRNEALKGQAFGMNLNIKGTTS